VYHESQTHSRIIVTRGSVYGICYATTRVLVGEGEDATANILFISRSPSRVIILSLLYTLAFYLFSRNYISTINLRAAYLTFVINSRPTSSFLYFFLPLDSDSALRPACIFLYFEEMLTYYSPSRDAARLNSPW
jgi:hypothetical protein